jgi:hypothetical protein
MSEPREQDNPEIVHEESDVNVRAILGFGIALVVAAVIILVFLWQLQSVYQRQTDRAQMQMYPLAAGQQEELPPMPRLQEHPQQDMQELRERQRALLNGYGWVNRDAGIARIPIDEAMRMVVGRGLPARETAK